MMSEVKLICAADLEPEPIHWLWRHWLAIGKLHLLVGSPSVGKTTLALNLAAIITRGGQWPDGSCSPQGNILIWSGEDNPEDTLLPRLLANQADPSRIYFVGEVNENNKLRAFNPARDIPKLYEKVSQIGGVQLILIDPVVNVVSGDSHKNGEVRRDLQPLVELASKLQCVILGITHFSKGTLGRDPLERVIGSIAFTALARMVLVAAHIVDKNGALKRLLVRAKSNNGPDGDGYYYQLEQVTLSQHPGVLSSQIIWGELVEGSAQALLVDTTVDDQSVLKETIHFLKILLSEGPLCKKEIDEKAREAGFKDISLRRAKAFLGIEALHDGFGKGSVWKWHLPEQSDQKSPEDALIKEVEH